jgi:hypothetical protein
MVARGYRDLPILAGAPGESMGFKKAPHATIRNSGF